MGEEADRLVERMQGFGVRRRVQRRQDHDHEARRDFAIAKHDLECMDALDDLPLEDPVSAEATTCTDAD